MKKKRNKKESPGRLFYTGGGININDRIKNGKTKAFAIDERFLAIRYSESINSYAYDMFNGNFKFCGYAVPN